MTSRTPRPPAVGRILLRLWRLGDRRAEMEEDLRALFEIRRLAIGIERTRWRYLLDVLSLWRCRPTDAAGTIPEHYGGIDAMRQDIVFAVRVFRRQPLLFGLTIAGLGLAIGISTAVASVVRGVVFADYGFANPASVYRVALSTGPLRPITGSSGTRGNWGASEYAALEASASSLTVVAAARSTMDFRATSAGTPESVGVLAVSGNYFPVLGLRSVVGRTLLPADDQQAEAVIVSYGFWKNRLGADQTAVGRTIWLDDRVFTIVGVSGRQNSTPYGIPQMPAFWMTLSSHAAIRSAKAEEHLRDLRSRLAVSANNPMRSADENQILSDIRAELTTPLRPWNPAVEVFGRLAPGASRAQAEGEATSIALTLAGASRPGTRPSAHLQSIDDGAHAPGTALSALGLAVAFVIFLACANVTNLLLASAVQRRREIGTRLAVGASRRRIAQQLLTESALLGAISGALGLWAGATIVPLFAALVGVPPAYDVSPDNTVSAIIVTLSILAGVIAGLAPVRYGRREDLVATLRSDMATHGPGAPGGRMRALLLAGQATASIVLLVLAALMARGLQTIASLDPGVSTERLISVNPGGGVGGRPWTASRAQEYWRTAMERTRQLPGVASVSLALVPPFDGVIIPQPSGAFGVLRNETTPDYFATVGIRLLRGRIYTDEELRTGAPVAVISDRIARTFWGTSNPIGASLDRVWGPADAPGTARGAIRKPPGTRIVGVVSDAVTSAWRYRDAPSIYMPLTDPITARLVARTQEDPHSLIRPLVDALTSADPTMKPAVTLAADGFQRELEAPRILMALSSSVAIAALALATIGLFAVTAFLVEHRTHEIGVRRALGATTTDLLVLFLRETLTPVGVGVCCGIALALLGGGVIQSVLSGVSGRDPFALGTAVLVMLITACLAVLLPARRGIQVDPAQLLKRM